MGEKREYSVVIAIGNITAKQSGKIIGSIMDSKQRHAPNGAGTIAFLQGGNNLRIERRKDDGKKK